MQRNLNMLNRGSRLLRWGSLAMAAVALTACGPLGDDETDPTATSEVFSQPTASDLENQEATPTFDTSQPGVSLATPEVGFSTPIISNPVDPVNSQATPEASLPEVAGTPVATGSPAEEPAGDDDSAAGPVFSGSDGTSGATPDLGGADAAPGPAGTPSVDPPGATDGTSPAETGSTPVAGELDGLEPQVVTSCTPESIPPFGGEQASFLTATDVNFRTGPGADCDVIGDGPIGANIPVTVLSAPVVREDDDQFEWVQVQILEQTGWVVLEVLEPAP